MGQVRNLVQQGLPALYAKEKGQERAGEDLFATLLHARIAMVRDQYLLSADYAEVRGLPLNLSRYP